MNTTKKVLVGVVIIAVMYVAWVWLQAQGFEIRPRDPGEQRGQRIESNA